MDPQLRPRFFDADPNSADAAKRWNHWFRTFETYLKTVESSKPDKLETLIHFVDPLVYDHIADHTDYESAIATLRKLYVRPKNVIYARYLLQTYKQESGQDIDQFVQKLKSLAKDCEFKSVSATEYQDECVRDAIINGLVSTSIREKLLAQSELTLDQTYQLARSLELAHKQSQSYVSNEPISCSTIPPISQNPELRVDPTTAAVKSIQTCYFCGYDAHPRPKCPAREAVCNLCGKRGHFRRVCRSKNTSKFHTSCTTKPTLSSLFVAAAPTCLAHAIATIEVNGITLRALVDTGSSCSFINAKVVKLHNWKIYPTFSVVTMASTSLSCRTTGYACVSVRYRDTSYSELKLFVMPNLCTDVLLGHDFLGLHGKVEISFGGDRDALTICGLTAVNVESPSLFANLSPDCKPVATKSRRHHPDDEKFIRAEVDRLLQEGIIEPSTSPWRAQVLITKGINHKRRMVVDYSQTINRFTYLDAYPLPRLDKMIEEISHYEVYSTLDLLSAYHQVPISASDKPFTAFEACGGLFQFRRIPFGVTNGVACFQRTINNIITTEKLKSTYAYIDNVTICGKTQEEHDLNLQSFLRTTRKYGITLNDDKTVTSSKVIRLLGYEVSKGVIRPDPERMEPIRQLPLPRTTTEMQRIIGMFAYYAHWISSFSDKINKLVKNKTFPLPADVELTFDNLKNELENATLITIDYNEPLVVETDASDVAIAASLSQNRRPVAFFSRTLNPSEKNHSAIEKEAYAIVESIRKWRHYLLGRPFKLITDQRSVSFMYGGGQKGKVKNDKIQRWRIELSEYKYDVIYRPGKDNHVADTLSRNVCASMGSNNQLGELHNSLCHPGITRMFHFVRCKNLPYSVDDVKRVISSCKVCAELKPRFWKSSGRLIKATQPFERLSLDFKGPLPSNTRNRYLLTIIDEFSRFPFAFACADMTSATVIDCLTQIFCLFGMPAYIHSDRGSSFMSSEINSFLLEKGVAMSHTSAYNPQCNGQVERLNGTLWKTISLALKSHNLPHSRWESVLPDALHSLRSLLCTVTNCTPHERLFQYARRSTFGISLPSWLTTPGPVLLQRGDRSSKYQPLVEEVDLLNCNPHYAHIAHRDGRVETVSLRRLAPAVQSTTDNVLNLSESNEDTEHPDTTELTGRQPDSSQASESSSVPSSEHQPSYPLILEQQRRIHPYSLRNREP